jgi:rubrerythrin
MTAVPRNERTIETAARESASTRAASLPEVLAIADELERAAVARYVKLADGMRQVGRGDLAATFESLANEERHHVNGVARLLQDAPTNLDSIDLQRWALPEAFSAEEAEPASLLSPYKALSIAVRGEERAFTFWTYIASTAPDQAVRARAEEMARQELVHAAKLRRARRHAYHAEYPYGRRRLESRSFASVAAVRSELRRLEAEVHVPLSEIARRLECMPDTQGARLMYESIVELVQAEPTPLRVTHADISYRIHCAASAGEGGLLFEAVGLLERLLESSLDMLGATTDAAAAAAIQDWADRTIRIVARLNMRLYALEPKLADMAAVQPPTMPPL